MDCPYHFCILSLWNNKWFCAALYTLITVGTQISFLCQLDKSHLKWNVKVCLCKMIVIWKYITGVTAECTQDSLKGQSLCYESKLIAHLGTQAIWSMHMRMAIFKGSAHGRSQGYLPPCHSHISNLHNLPWMPLSSIAQLMWDNSFEHLNVQISNHS